MPGWHPQHTSHPTIGQVDCAAELPGPCPNRFLSYDNDGNGAHAAIQFALNNHPVLAANDFLVI